MPEHWRDSEESVIKEQQFDKTNSLTENALLRYLILFVNRNQESQLVPDIFPLIYFCKHVCLSRDA